ncbi:MAG: hypothetical protein AB7V16_08955 [Vulcanibacillus sp.]
MKGFFKKTLSLLVIVGLILGMTACSSTSEDPYTETSTLFSAINKVEKFNPGGMNFTKEQAEGIIALIAPALNGAIYTTDMAEDIYKKMNDILTKEQLALIDETLASLGVPVEGAVPGAGGGMGAGAAGGTPGVPPTTGSTAETSVNMFIKIDEVITANYLN